MRIKPALNQTVRISASQSATGLSTPVNSAAWSYVGIPYVTDPVPSAILPALPTGADFNTHQWCASHPTLTTYDPCTIVTPVVGDIADWNNAPDAYYVKFDGNDGTAGNGGRGNPTNPRRTLPAGPFTAGTKLFVEGAGTPIPTSASDPNKAISEFTDWRVAAAIPSFNSAGTYTGPSDICWLIGINRPRISTQGGTSFNNSNHIIFDGIVFSGAPGEDNKSGSFLPSGCNYFTMRNSWQFGPSDGTSNNTGGQAFGISNTTFHCYYNNELAYFGAFDVIGDPDFHGWRPNYGNRWLWCINNKIHSLKGDSTQIGNSNNTQTEDQVSHYVYFAGNESYNNQENMVDCKNSAHVIVSQNLCHDFDGAGGGGANATGIIISQDGEGPHSTYHWALANRVWNCGTGIRAAGNNDDGNLAGSGEPSIMDRDRIIGNLIYDCTGPGMNVNHGASTGRSGQTHVFVHNTVARCAQGWIGNLFQPASTSDCSVRRNIFFECTGDEIDITGNNGLGVHEVVDNLLYKAAGGETLGTDIDVQSGNVLGSDPLFVNAAGNDFRLASTSSPAYNMAAAEDPVFAEFQSMYGIDIREDFNRVPRPQGAAFDVGAFEFI